MIFGEVFEKKNIYNYENFAYISLKILPFFLCVFQLQILFYVYFSFFFFLFFFFFVFMHGIII